jgi:hypothetical protein
MKDEESTFLLSLRHSGRSVSEDPESRSKNINAKLCPSSLGATLWQAENGLLVGCISPRVSPVFAKEFDLTL